VTGRYLFIFLLVFALLAFAQIAGAQPTSSLPHVPGRVLVQFKQGITESQANAVLTALSSRSVGQVPQTGVHIVQLPPNANEAAFANVFAARPEINFAELDRILRPADLTPNDPWYANWQWYLPKISAPAAWSTSIGSASIIIAIVDTGVYGAHEDLASKLVPGWNIYSNNSDTSDVYGHGTQVAGTAAAMGNNGIGVASVCWNCSIMPIRVSDSTGSATYSALASGTTWAADHGARVANMSFIVSDSSTVSSAARYFQQKGGVVTSSAGNYSAFDSTADNPYILTVSATDPNDNLYSWSNTGKNVDVAAPGCVYTTANGGGYTSGCGTSFSAPIVAGVAGLILSANPSLSPSQVTKILQQSADDIGAPGWDPSFGWGRVNAAKAVSMALSNITTTTAPAVSFQSPLSGATISGTAGIQVSASSSAGVTSVTLYVDNVLTGTSTVSPYAWSVNTTSLSNSSHSLMAVAKDTLGNSSSAAISVTVNNSVPDATPPTASVTSPANGATVSGNITVSVTAADNVGIASLDLLVDGTSAGTDTAAPYTFKVNTAKWVKGAHTLQARARDAAGNVGLSAVVTVYK
jgi:subtilisin family serine protease